MQSVYDQRRVNLRSLIGQWGGPTSLAKKLGHSNGSYLAQLAGPNPSREISERVAREIEQKLGLPAGWLDQEQHGNGNHKPLDDETLTACVRCVATVLRDANLRPDPESYATLVQLTYEHCKAVGRIDERYVQKLVQLTRGSGK